MGTNATRTALHVRGYQSKKKPRTENRQGFLFWNCLQAAFCFYHKQEIHPDSYRHHPGDCGAGAVLCVVECNDCVYLYDLLKGRAIMEKDIVAALLKIVDGNGLIPEQYIAPQ